MNVRLGDYLLYDGKDLGLELLRVEDVIHKFKFLMFE